jgi:hypothetical protein
MKITEHRFWDMLKEADVYKLLCQDMANLIITYRHTPYTLTVPFSICLELRPFAYLAFNIIIYKGSARVEDPEIIDLDRFLQDSFTADPVCEKNFKEAVKAIYQ